MACPARLPLSHMTADDKVGGGEKRGDNGPQVPGPGCRGQQALPPLLPSSPGAWSIKSCSHDSPGKPRCGGPGSGPRGPGGGGPGRLRGPPGGPGRFPLTPSPSSSSGGRRLSSIRSGGSMNGGPPLPPFGMPICLGMGPRGPCMTSALHCQSERPWAVLHPAQSASTNQLWRQQETCPARHNSALTSLSLCERKGCFWSADRVNTLTLPLHQHGGFCQYNKACRSDGHHRCAWRDFA